MFCREKIKRKNKCLAMQKERAQNKLELLVNSKALQKKKAKRVKNKECYLKNQDNFQRRNANNYVQRKLALGTAKGCKRAMAPGGTTNVAFCSKKLKPKHKPTKVDKFGFAKKLLNAGIFKTKNKKIIAESYKRFLVKRLTERLVASESFNGETKKQRTKSISHKLKCQVLAGRILHLKRQLYSAYHAQLTSIVSEFKDFVQKIKEIGSIDPGNLAEVVGGKRLHSSMKEAYFHETTYYVIGNNGKILKNGDESHYGKIFKLDSDGSIRKVLRDRATSSTKELFVDEMGNIVDMKNNNATSNVELVLQVNESGVVTNLFNIVETEEKNPKANFVINEGGFIETLNKTVYWECSDICNVRTRAIAKVLAFVNTVANANEKSLTKIFDSDLDLCELRKQFCKKSNVSIPPDGDEIVVRIVPFLGHTAYCADSEECQSHLRALAELAPHYSGIRNILNNIYHVKALLNALTKISTEIESGDYESVTNVMAELRKTLATRGKNLNKEQNDAPEGSVNAPQPSLDESQILSLYENQFARAMLNTNEFHDTPCDCCLRLLKKSDLRAVEKLVNRAVFENEAYLILRAGWIMNNSDTREADMLLCRYCATDLGKGKVPIRCFLNNLAVDNPPLDVTSLNMFEKVLIQLVKAFHTVVRLGTKTNSNMQFGTVKALKGRVIYLPIPVEKNLKMIPKTLPKNHELHILVNGVPTADKKVWQQVVCLEKVLKAFSVLKKINPFYKDIDISTMNEEYICGTQEIDGNENSLTPEELLSVTDPLALINDGSDALTRASAALPTEGPADSSHDVQGDQNASNMQDQDENQSSLAPGDAYKILTQPEALLRKLSEGEANDLYDHYSIHPVNVQPPKDLLGAYQMKRVEAEPVSTWDKNLEYMSFVHLFPRGRFGKHDDRPFGKITETEYRLSRLLNKSPIFRRDYAYLFHSYQECEMKAISSSLNYVLRVKKPMPIGVENLLNRVESGDKELESNLATFLGHIRGTKDYWYKVLRYVLAMIREFGPPTWLLTFNPAEYDDMELHDHLRKVNSDVPGVESMTVAELLNLDPLSVNLHFHNKVRSLLNNFVLCKQNPVLGMIEHHFWRVEYQSRGLPHYHMLLWAKDAPKIGTSSTETILDYVQKHVTCSMPRASVSPELHRLVKKFQTHKCTSSCYKKVKNSKKGLKVCRYGFPRNVTNIATMNSVRSVTRHRKMKKVQKRLYDLPRKQHEVLINDYNPTLLLASKANMDLQFVADKSEIVANYVTAYVTKGDRADVDQTFAELGNESLSKKLFAYRLKSLTCKQIGIYEALDMMLGQDLFNKSDSTKFINTNLKENRSRILKGYKELARLRETDPESTDTCQKGFVDDKYPNRPDSLENLSLREFGQFYDYAMRSEGVEKNANVIQLKNNLGFMRKRIKPYIIEHFIHDPIEEKEQYCHALLILFKPWRDETELLGDFETYADAFENSLSVLKDMREYHEKLSVSKEVEKKRKASKKAKEPETIVSETESDDNENALQGKEIVIETEHAMADVEAAMEMNFETDVDNVALLNSDQRRIYDRIMDHFSQEGEKCRNKCLFVSGPGGTGKSFLIDTLANGVRRRFQNPASVAIAAPTGLAALNVNGVTLHRLLMLPVDHGRIAEYHSLSSDNMSIMKETLGNLKLLIIDEISMVSSVLLTHVHLRLNEFWEMNQPFGGVVFILVLGDFFQLPPVQGNPAFIKITSEEARLRFNCIGGSDLWKFFKYDELTQNVRQANDQSYGDILSRVRIGNISEADVATLGTRLVEGGQNIEVAMDLFIKLSNEGFHPICLMPKLAMCVKFNFDMLRKNGEKVEVIRCQDRLADYGKKMNKNILRRLQGLQNEPSKTGGLESELVLCVGCRIMVRRNISFEKGVVNGTMGFVTGFKKDEQGNVTGIFLRVDREPNNDDANTDFLVEKICVKFLLMANVYVKRSQFPVILAYAITIHKSQGMSLKCAIMDLGPNLFGTGMAYVALSRVTSLAGLHLLQFDPTKIKVDGRAIMEYNRLRKKYRPDLPLLEITELKESRGRKRSAPTLSKSLLEGEEERCAETPKKKRKTQQSLDSLPLKGLANDDQVTCYSNSVLQLLLLVPELRELVKSYNGSFVEKPVLRCLHNTINDIESSQGSFSRKGLELRMAVGNHFTLNDQQDASEFLMVLLTTLSQEMEADYSKALKDLFWSKSRNVTKCPNCQVEQNSENIVESNIFNLPLENRDKIDWKSLEKRMRLTEVPCVFCNNPKIQERDVLISSGKYVFLCLLRGDYKDGRPIKISTKISSFENQNVTMSKMLFKTKGVIIHKGESLAEGHYVNFVRKDNGWYEVSDTMIRKRERFVSNLTDVTVLLLERVQTH